MKEFNSFDELITYIDTTIDETLTGEVADYIKLVMTDHMRSDVYNVYSPSVYERRYTDGGLLDEDYIVQRLSGNENTSELFSTTVAPYNEKKFKTPRRKGKRKKKRQSTITFTPEGSLGQMINDTGFQRHNPPYDAYEFPRPFMTNTAKDISSNGVIVQMLKDALS